MKAHAFGRFRAADLAAVYLSVIGCGTNQPAVKGPIPPGPYVVLDAEDNLSNISLRAYGDMKFWYSLLNANPQLAKRPGFDLMPGETINVPAREKIDMRLPKSVFPKQLPAEYIVMPGDSLHFIAQNVYGDRELWPLIYEANRSVLSERVKQDTRQLIAGQVLWLPSKDQAEKTSSSGVRGIVE
jgi:nucleoid-associated protein YgaU